MKKHRTKSKRGHQKRQYEADILDLPSLRLVVSTDSQEAFSEDSQPSAQRNLDHSPEMIQQIIERIKTI